MSGPVNPALIPARFLFTIGHFLVLLMMLNVRATNVKASIPSAYTQSQYDTADASLRAAIALSITCICIDIIALLGSFSMFSPFMNALHCLSHFFSTVLLSIFIQNQQHYIVAWYVFFFLTMPVTILELGRIVIIGIFTRMEF
jgi:hypothetical protein